MSDNTAEVKEKKIYEKNEALALQVIEECSELQKRVSRSMRFGYLSWQRERGINIVEVTESYYRVCALMGLMLEEGQLLDLNSWEIESIKRERLDKFQRYLDYCSQNNVPHK